jgi:hypothetical protein
LEFQAYSNTVIQAIRSWQSGIPDTTPDCLNDCITV